MSDARSRWDERIGVRSGEPELSSAPVLNAPGGVVADAGGAQVTLSWDPVPGAIGYQVCAAGTADGDLVPLDHGGGDVLAMPHPPYTDTTGTVGTSRWYAVAALSDTGVESPPSPRVSAVPLATAGPVQVVIDAAGDTGELPRPWRPMIGSEHLSYALSTQTTGGCCVGDELTSALRAAHEELGVRTVRAHAILSDDVAVYREVDGMPVHDFTGVDRVYDHVRGLGLYPVVELSFMPRDLARDPAATVFAYGGGISPPKDWDRWHDLVRDLVAHLVDRYGRDDVVEHWSFEVWNEANLEVFWSGTPEDYLHLYDVTAHAVRSVDDRLLVGGPASAAAGWVEDLLAHTEESGSAVDFVSTHTYGSPPLDFRPTLERYGRGGTPIWWTEWGVTPRHFDEVSDAVFAGVFLLRGMASAMGRIEALSYWVVSDHFEELGPPPELFHGGFGLRTVGELRKPRWWALWLLERLGSLRLPLTLSGDGGGSLVEAVATRGRHDEVSVLAWNLTLDQSKASGDARLGRAVTVAVESLPAGTSYVMTHYRVDADHSNVPHAWQSIRTSDDQAWPDEGQWQALRAADRLDQLEAPRDVLVDDQGILRVCFDLPMPAMSFLQLTPHL